MIKNYFKITLRNLWKTKGYSFLNIFGLAVGIAAASLIFLWVEDELSYNKHIPDKENIYTVKSRQVYDGTTHVFGASQGLLAGAIEAEIPGIRHAVRSSWDTSLLFNLGDNNIYQTGRYVDPDFISVFALEFLEGDRQSALSDINNLVITASAAKRMFGNEPALGKQVRIDNDESYTVSGVVKDMPGNTSITFDWLIPFKNFERGKAWLKNWGTNGILTLVQLQPQADLADVNGQLDEFVIRKTNGETTFSRNFLYPMERWRLYDSFDRDGNEQEGRIKYVRLFSIIAWVVLLIACINFMNLATARSEKRAREVGMRKVVGASKRSLISQFLGESVILATVSALLAIGLIYLSVGAFNNLVEKELTIDLFRPAHLMFLAGIVLVCGLISGSYPAFYLSSFNPVTTLKGVKQKSGATVFIRRGLVVLQYAASITLIICTTIIFQQIEHTKGRDMGYDRSQVLTTQLRGTMLEHIDVIKDQLTATGDVERAGLSNMEVLNIHSNTTGISWEGKDPNKQVLIGILHTDADFVSTMGMQLTEGRDFRPRQLGDSSSIVINEAFARLIDPDGKVAGRTVRWGDTPYTVIGVVKDFVYNNVYAPSEPLFFHPFQADRGFINIKTRAGVDLSEAVSRIGQVIRENNPGYPFEYHFLDDTFNSKFKSEMLIQKLAGVFAVLSIIISCLGLFGLAAFTAERRTKEMGIRKVLGASVSSLMKLLNREFVLLVSVACTIAFPVTWWMMGNWLGSYDYRTEIHWQVFAFAGLGAFLIALFTVSSQAIRAALANPTKSLRDE
ncbi:ABC transporter permease [Sinomicrobium weinanense]|uniref:ABC transporter permease n=1 Tax=Sinomicrobium weinanense TaxID=2842200 RepID=A0A926JP30_9FLAO|nr:ABC transporter permease [Sinomicrobium weinanense]MBC9794855.1 ABC transporter permease [Sinomicrobium weinanense]MBU3125626.1 ABC transporter permease [Sinomicrobium weinanense]